jgi:hypothetical protein
MSWHLMVTAAVVSDVVVSNRARYVAVSSAAGGQWGGYSHVGVIE